MNKKRRKLKLATNDQQRMKKNQADEFVYTTRNNK